MFISIHDDNSVKLQLYTGREDAGENKPCTPLEYLHQFYTTNELIEGGSMDIFSTINELNSVYDKNLTINA